MTPRGHKPWNLGLTKETDSRVKKISEANKSKIAPKSTFKKGCVPWNKGLTTDDPRVRKYTESGAISKRGQHSSPKTEFKKGCIPISGFKRGHKTWNKDKPFMQKEKHPNWKGGISGEGYPRKFNRPYKEQVRLRDNHICQLCGKPQEEQLLELIKLLSVHHIDYNKKNNDEENLITLCTKCHMKTNYYRNYYKEYFLLFMEEKVCQK